MKNKEDHSVRTDPKSNRKIVETGKFDTPNTNIHDHSNSWLDTGNVIKSG